uniref:Uncharacterized protein n=1 Tax=Trypanosoma congolense (strain IL3000) TaxID=1068625 RepID=G0UKF9_TRYCI|nr:conserved hypothetical protein [Trypanosoma congolense IL3000]
MSKQLLLHTSVLPFVEGGAAYIKEEVTGCDNNHCLGKKRERLTSASTSSENNDCSVNGDSEDVVKRSERLLEFLRGRRSHRGCAVYTLSPDCSEHACPALSASFSLSLPCTTHPPCCREDETTNCDQNQSESSPIVRTTRPALADGFRSVAIQTQASLPGFNNQMVFPTMTRPDLLALRLCELDALLRVFLS